MPRFLQHLFDRSERIACLFHFEINSQNTIQCLTCHSWPKCGLSQRELRKYLFRIGIAMWNAQYSCRELCQNSKSQFISSFHMWNLLPILVSWYPNRDHNTGVIIMLKRSFYVSGRVPHIIPSQFFIPLSCSSNTLGKVSASIVNILQHFVTCFRGFRKNP